MVRANFDANFPEKADDYDILISTEVLAEGVNLHRANIVVNYDTPWNSTRLMQRVGRVNRIGATAPKGIVETEGATPNSFLSPEEARALLNQLDDFRACDPAVGSGAFLVSLLHELLNLQRLCETRARGKDPADADIDGLYENKKRIIEKVLYGVDLQQRAVEICKLRLWISLMVDYPLDVDPDN